MRSRTDPLPKLKAGVDARSLRGRLSLLIAGEGGRTRLAAAERTPPWGIQRLLYLDPAWPALATVTLLNTTAGLFAGDRLELELTVQAGAAVAVTTPAMTRVFAMADGAAEVTARLRVAAGGYLEYLPEPLMLCRDAALRQATRLELEPGAVAALGEVIAFGRAAYGERHAYRELRQRTDVTRGGGPVLAECLNLRPASDPEVAGMLGTYAAFGSLNLLCDACDGEAMLGTARRMLAGQPRVWGGGSLLAGGVGIGVRLLGETPHATQSALRALVAGFRSCHPH